MGLFGAKRGGKTLVDTLRSEQLKSDIVLNAIDDGVVIVDSQQTLRLFNPAAATITGWTVEDASGLDWRSVLKFVDTKGQVRDEDAPLRLVFSQGKTIRENNALLLTKSDTTISVSITVSPLLDDTRQVTGAVGVFRDVSAERQEEAQRADFISTASHEMRTPVAAIEGYLSLALNDKVATLDERAKGYLEKAHAATKHLGQLFQDLLTSAKAEDGRLTNHPEVIEMGSFMEQLTSDLRFTADKKQLAMDFAIGSSDVIDASAPAQLNVKVIRPLYYVHVDPDRLREVVTNLFDNACKYTDQGKISLGLTGNDQVVQIYVRDTGHGIPAEDVPHLFQKFYRVDNSATRTIGGTGLGLFICRKIIELYGGRIWVESTLGQGSIFYINLPRLSTQQAETLKAQTPLEGVPTATLAGTPLNEDTVGLMSAAAANASSPVSNGQPAPVLSLAAAAQMSAPPTPPAPPIPPSPTP